jgi:hypothetical protein
MIRWPVRAPRGADDKAVCLSQGNAITGLDGLAVHEHAPAPDGVKGVAAGQVTHVTGNHVSISIGGDGKGKVG